MSSPSRKIVTKKPGSESRIISLAGVGRLLDIEAIQGHGIDIKNFVIFLGGIPLYYESAASVESGEPGVEYQMADKFIKSLHILSSKNPKRPILIRMKTNGGFWEEGMAMFDAMRTCTNPLTVVSYTHARSMSSIILQAADKRVMMPNSHFMFHEGTWGMNSTTKQVRSNFEFSERVQGPTMLDIYARAMTRKFVGTEKPDRKVLKEALLMMLKRHVPNLELKRYVNLLLGVYESPMDLFKRVVQICMDTKEDVFLTADETVEWGFADLVLKEDESGKVDWSSLLKYT